MSSPPISPNGSRVLGEKDVNLLSVSSRRKRIGFVKDGVFRPTDLAKEGKVQSTASRAPSPFAGVEQSTHSYRACHTLPSHLTDIGSSPRTLDRLSPISHESACSEHTEETAFPTHSRDYPSKRQRESSEDVEAMSVGSMPCKKQRRGNGGFEAEGTDGLAYLQDAELSSSVSNKDETNDPEPGTGYSASVSSGLTRTCPRA